MVWPELAPNPAVVRDPPPDLGAPEASGPRIRAAGELTVSGLQPLLCVPCSASLNRNARAEPLASGACAAQQAEENRALATFPRDRRAGGNCRWRHFRVGGLPGTEHGGRHAHGPLDIATAPPPLTCDPGAGPCTGHPVHAQGCTGGRSSPPAVRDPRLDLSAPEASGPRIRAAGDADSGQGCSPLLCVPCSVGGNDLPRGQERQSTFSQLVYTNNDSYIIQYGDLRKIHKAVSRGQVSKLQKMTLKKKTINLNVKRRQERDQMIPSESKQKDKEENSWDLEEEATKTVTGQHENDIGIIEQAPQDQTNKIPTSESRQKEDTESSDSEIISESDIQNYVCLTEATYQKEIKTINGKIEESTEKPSDFEPAVEMQNSVPNKALEWRNKQTLRADSPSLSKNLDAVPSCKRARELIKDHWEQLTAKTERMKNKICVLKKEISKAKEIKSQLENQKVKREQELCSVRLTLNQEEEKRRNEKIRKELGRIEEQHRKELEVKQELEQALRIQDMEVKSVRSNLSQVSHTHENENNLLHENCMLRNEIAMQQLEIDKLTHQRQEKENKYFKDLKILKEKNAELQMTLKLQEESLTKRASQYSGQLKVLMAENTELTSKLKEKQDKEIREREIESHHPRLASAVQDRDQIVTPRKSQGLAFHTAGDASLQGKINVDVNNTIYNNEVLHQPLSEAQRESKSLKINLNYAGDALRENTLVSEHAQRERDETQYQMKKAEHMYQNEQDNVNIHNEQQESLEQKLCQLQSKNMWLRQQLVHARNKADNKSKITTNIPLLERKTQHQLLKEKNEELFNYNRHLKDCIYKYEKEKEERQVSIKKYKYLSTFLKENLKHIWRWLNAESSRI
ncbi:PREDICTED: ankyrin repeat domain-containing protein 30A-like [Cercocebus atys]|uniref:ankyrin repeat domain-containing protein 30A-like n=1 Tax=Cercocebus atys TaxID=9531 RepID=UPI0005F430E5|nr:PREDICTED: ankyrin repeat domain-containing protein 30A-like [Cercocebus atys]